MLGMKILVCIDGSEHSQKVLEKAAIIAAGVKATEIAVIHVDEGKFDVPSFQRGSDGYVAEKEIERFLKIQEEHHNKIEKILSDGKKYFADRNLEAKTVLKVGHPADSIVNVACEQGYDLIVVGSRGLGGLQKLFLGSVSNAVIQQAKNCDVLTVK
jgi:nucleotide-binding universal stress UspA family protein